MAKSKAQTERDRQNQNRNRAVDGRKKDVDRQRDRREVAKELESSAVEDKPPEQQKFEEIQAELRLLERRTKGNPTDADADIDFAYRKMALPNVTPIMAPSPSAWEWYLFARNDRDEFLKICAKREDAKAKMAGTITNQRMEDDKRQQFAVIERLKKELTMDVAAIIKELMEKYPEDVLRECRKFDAQWKAFLAKEPG